MQVRVNGEYKNIANELNVASLLKTLSLSLGGIAVAVNQQVIPKSEWQLYFLSDQDDIMVIKATAGG